MRSVLSLTRGSRFGVAWFVGGLVAGVIACAHASGPERYRLRASGTHWDVAGSDQVLADLLPRYPQFFRVILDPERTEDPDLRPVRADLEHRPPDRRNYDALNAVAIGYFELNYRAETLRGQPGFLGQSFRAARLLAIPWRAYSEIEDGRLRDAILDFFEDAASGEKLATAATAARLARVVRSLERKESDPKRLARIRALADSIEVRYGKEAPR